MTPVYAYTDGGCSPNPGSGGWGVVLMYGDRVKELCGGALDTTNNRMELISAIKALEALTRPCRVTVYTDSQYVKNGITDWIHAWKRRGWRTAAGKPVLNADLWDRLDQLTHYEGHKVTWVWVKGHAGDAGNERADQLAAEGRRQTLAAAHGTKAVAEDVGLAV